MMENLPYPTIKFEDKTYYQVGCKVCAMGESWLIFRNHKNFIAKCKNCDRIIEISIKNIYTKPDGGLGIGKRTTQ